MPTLHVEVTLTVDDLVKAAQRLDDEDFERFLVAVQWVASRRKAKAPSAPAVAAPASPRDAEKGQRREV